MTKTVVSKDLEIRRFETIYKTFLKMDNAQRKRALVLMISKFNNDLIKPFHKSVNS